MRISIFKRALIIFILFVVACSFVYGQNDPDAFLDTLVFKIVVYGPSDGIFIWWGHAALIVEYTRWNFSRVFDWGVFTYPSYDTPDENFLKDFLREEVQYKCTGSIVNMEMYIEEDRDITVYTLNLDRNAKKIILVYAEDIIMPDKCFYDYHEFRDNCSTRIRDIIDMGTEGQFKAVFGASPGRFSIRQHVRRFTWDKPFSDWFLDFLVGQNLDGKTTCWDEMFLPVEVARNIVDFTYTDSSGVECKLVSSVQIVNSSKKRQPILNEPIATWPFVLAVGLLAAALLFFVILLGKKFPRSGRVILGSLQSLLGLFFGFSGCVLVFGFLMNNDYIQQNANILFINPLLLAMVPLGILYAANVKFPFTEKCLRIIWTYMFIACTLTVLLRLLPFFYQQNQSAQAVILPIAFVLSYIPGWIGTGYRRVRSDSAV
jgi:hypothetical protein